MDGDVVDSNLSRQMAEREAAITKMTLMVCIIFNAFLVTELELIKIPINFLGVDRILCLLPTNIIDYDNRSNAT